MALTVRAQAMFWSLDTVPPSGKHSWCSLQTMFNTTTCSEFGALPLWSNFAFIPNKMVDGVTYDFVGVVNTTLGFLNPITLVMASGAGAYVTSRRWRSLLTIDADEQYAITGLAGPEALLGPFAIAPTEWYPGMNGRYFIVGKASDGSGNVIIGIDFEEMQQVTEYLLGTAPLSGLSFVSVSCPGGNEYYDLDLGCQPCDDLCRDGCTGPDPSDCTHCTYAVIEGVCVDQCPVNTYFQTGSCVSCTPTSFGVFLCPDTLSNADAAVIAVSVVGTLTMLFVMVCYFRARRAPRVKSLMFTTTSNYSRF
jgi:hypothetical protein